MMELSDTIRDAIRDAEQALERATRDRVIAEMLGHEPEPWLDAETAAASRLATLRLELGDLA